MSKRYLGDGVYADYDEEGYHLILTTENGIQVENVIYLDPSVIHSLLEYIEDHKK